MSSTEDEQLADFKEWWSRNGKPLVTGGLLALVIVFGWQAFQKYQSNQSQGASMLYQQLLETTLTPDGKPDAARVSDLAGKLNSEFGGSAWARSRLRAALAVSASMRPLRVWPWASGGTVRNSSPGGASPGSTQPWPRTSGGLV